MTRVLCLSEILAKTLYIHVAMTYALQIHPSKSSTLISNWEEKKELSDITNKLTFINASVRLGCLSLVVYLYILFYA